MAPSTGEPRGWGEFITPMAWVQMALVAGLMAFVYWSPIKNDLVWKWQNDGNWSHGWLVPVFSLYFLNTRREAIFRCRFRPNYFGAVVLALSLALGFISSWGFRYGYPQAVSMLGAMLGLILLFGGWELVKIAWFPVFFLIFAIPLPQGYYAELTTPLREFASKAAAALMPVFAPGLYAEAQNVVIDYSMAGRKPGTLNVEDACSGMRLLMSFVTLGVAMAYLGDRPVWQRLVMVASCVPIAILCNTIRVTITGLLFVYGHEGLAKGTPHQLLGIAMLVVALGCYALIGYILSHLWVEEAAA